MSEELKHVTCPTCGATLDYREGDAVAFCVYCNTTVQLRETKETEEQYTLEITVDRNSLAKFIVGDILKVPGAPQSIKDQFQIKEAKLVYVPYYVGQVHGTLEWSGLGRQAEFAGPYRGGYRFISFYTAPEQGIFDDHTIVIVYAGDEKAPHVDVLKKYRFATKGRRFFSQGEIEKEDAEVIQPRLTFEEGKQYLINTLTEKHKRLLNEELEVVQAVNPNYEVTQVQLIYVPMWFVKWTTSGSGKTYDAILDAASGETLITNVPRTKSFWAVTIGVILAYIILAVIPFLIPFVEVLRNTSFAFAVALLPGVLAIQTIVKVSKTTFKEQRK